MKAKEKDMIRLAVLLLMIGLLIVAGVFAVNGFNPVRLLRGVSGFEEREAVLIDDFSEIRILDVDASIRVLPSEDGKCSVYYDQTDKSTYTIKIGDSALIIEHKKSWLDSFGFFMTSPRLTVYLPQANYEALNVQNVSGSIRVEGLQFGEMNLKTTSGSIQLDDVRIEGEAALKTVSGSVRLTSAQAGGLTAGTTSGGIRLDGVDAETLEMRTVSGSIKGTLCSGKVFEASSVSGRVRVPESTPGAGVCSASTTSGGISISVEE